MLEQQSHYALKQAISNQVEEDIRVLDNLRCEVRPLRGSLRRIQPRSTTAISLVGTDGGNNRIQFDPFLVQLVRVVDSSNNEYCLEAITPTTDVTELGRAQFLPEGQPRTPLGHMLAYLGLRDLPKLSHMIRRNDRGEPTSSSWVQVYRELMEWAVLFSILRNKDFATDTIIVCDGLLRSKVFAADNFVTLRRGFQEAIEHQWKQNRRRIYLVGVAKHSKVLDRYRLALALERVLTSEYPAYVPVPRELEEQAYVWSEYARGDDRVIEGGEINRYVAGKMFFVKFGSGPRDPIWPIDIFIPQEADAQTVLGYLLADATDGFPIPFYPRCLQKAHENASLVDFDFDVLQDEVFSAIRNALGNQSDQLDEFQLRDSDPSQRRY
ncbi:MAG: hypothetical protein OXG64_04590 [Chloroflexi bacterium]|nr:hypothetical protein [Chloroflexota bacterium]